MPETRAATVPLTIALITMLLNSIPPPISLANLGAVCIQLCKHASPRFHTRTITKFYPISNPHFNLPYEPKRNDGASYFMVSHITQNAASRYGHKLCRMTILSQSIGLGLALLSYLWQSQIKKTKWVGNRLMAPNS